MGQALAFVATCPTCGHTRLQNAFSRADLERLLNGGYPIEAYCRICDEFWTVGVQKRVEIIEAVCDRARRVVAFADRRYNVLFVCTGNTCRSIMGESLMNYWGAHQFRGYSAGSSPKGEVHPLALELLTDMQLPTDGLRSKSWSEFTSRGARPLDFVFTVCDSAAREVHPSWPGEPVRAHWGVEDPAALNFTEAEMWSAFSQAFKVMEMRVKLFANLPIASLTRLNLQAWADAIGKAKPDDAGL
jgi:arsenate reductase (thioredoxin)